jgi:hypothetical protein
MNGNYIDLLSDRIYAEVGVGPPGSRRRTRIRAIVADVMMEVQHRIYQDVMSNLGDIARQLSPETERKER